MYDEYNNPETVEGYFNYLDDTGLEETLENFMLYVFDNEYRDFTELDYEDWMKI